MNIPRSIEGAGGLRPFLEATKEIHRGLGYDAFKAMMEGRAGSASMQRSFNVSKPTMQKYRERYRLEAAQFEERPF